MPSKESLYNIGKAAEICSVNTKTLRYYDEINLVSPKYKDPSSGYRYYTQEQLYTIFMVRKFKTMGFTLKEVQEMLETGDISLLTEQIANKLEEVKLKIEGLQHKQTEGIFLLERLNVGKAALAVADKDVELGSSGRDTPGRVRLETIAPVEVLFTRGVKSNYKVLDISVERWVDVYEMAATQGMVPIGGIILTYHNKPLEQFFKNACDLEVSLPIMTSGKKTDSIKPFGGFQAATIIHSADYSDILNSHVNALKWIDDNGYAVGGCVSEEYIISPFDSANSKTYLTKIIVPITKAR